MKEREEWLFTSLLQHWYKWVWAELTFEISEKHSITKNFYENIKRGCDVPIYLHPVSLLSKVLRFFIFMVVLQRIYHIPTTKAPLFDTDSLQSKHLKGRLGPSVSDAFLGPGGPLVEPSNFPSRPSVRANFSRVHIYRHTCLMNHQKSHQTNPMAQRDPIDAPLTPGTL